MKTAVEYLIKEFSDILGIIDTNHMQNMLLVDAIEKAKELEKQQIIDAYEEGQRAEAKQEFWTKGNKYFTEKFKTK